MAFVTFLAMYLVVLGVAAFLCSVFGAGRAAFKIIATIITGLSLLWMASAIAGGVL